MPRHPKGSSEAADRMHKIRGVKLEAGSQAAKDFMKELRDKRKSNKNKVSEINKDIKK